MLAPHLEAHDILSLTRLPFSLQTSQEYNDMYMCVQSHRQENATSLNAKHGSKMFKEYKKQQSSSYPEAVDWRTAGSVTSVKDQVR